MSHKDVGRSVCMPAHCEAVIEFVRVSVRGSKRALSSAAGDITCMFGDSILTVAQNGLSL